MNEAKDAILGGTCLAIDPSSKSVGWAWYEAGERVESGCIKIPGTRINLRLQKLYDQLQEFEVPDVIFIEEIRGSQSHDYLKFSVGVTMASVRSVEMIEVPIRAWKKVAKITEGYRKTDENDAVIIGYSGILLAQELS